MQKLGDNHHAPTVDVALRFLRIRLRSRVKSAALADETAVVRATLKQKVDTWDDAVDESRAATAEVRYKDTRLDKCVKIELRAALGMFTSTMTQKQREAVNAKLFGGKPPSEGMKPIGGPAQEHYVDGILGHLATAEFASLSTVAAKITALRADLRAAEENRTARRTTEQVARSAVEDATEDAKRFYNHMHARLTLLFPDDPEFVESCFLDLRAAAPDQGIESRKRALAAVYRARFGALPREVSAALDEELDEARFNKLVEVFALESAEDIASALTA